MFDMGIEPDSHWFQSQDQPPNYQGSEKNLKSKTNRKQHLIKQNMINKNA